jgi:hypothetical protein
MGAAIAWQRRSGLAVPRGAVAIACALGAATPALGQSRSNVLSVSAIVVPSTKVDVVASAAMLDVTAEDVSRGYVEVRDAARLRITSTSRAGFRVDLHPRVPMFRAIEVRMDGFRAWLGPDGGTLVASGRTGRQMPARVDVRIELAQGVLPGRYPWPVALQVRPF